MSDEGAPARPYHDRLAREQDALREVATLVTQGAPEQAIFHAVSEAIARVVGAEATSLLRFEGDDTVTLVAAWSRHGVPLPIGDRRGINSHLREIRATGEPRRFDALPDDAPFVEEARALGMRSAISVPVTLDGRVWGVVFASSEGERPLPGGTEARMVGFTALVATALGNAQARTSLRRLLEEQAALRRVAELVARAAGPEELLDAVALESSNLLGGAGTSLLRFQPDGDAVVVATHREATPVGVVVPARGSPWSADRLRARRALRVAGFEGTPAEHLALEYDVDAVVVVPVMVEGRVWGMLSTRMPGGRFAPGTDERLAQFAELVGTAVANSESRAQLTASRARVVAAADESRRRLQRDVHDGAQQRLVQTVINLKLARQALAEHPWPAAHLIDEALLHAERATAELRDVVRGILPASLTRGGLRAGVETLCADLPLEVDLRVTAPRLPAPTETTAYFVIAEALANVVKHAGADSALVQATAEAGALIVEVRDDGVGGATPGGGSGLTGLFDRVEASDGTFSVESPAGGGTTLRARLPLTG